MEQEYVNSVVNAMSSLFREPVLEGGRAKGTLQFRLFFGKINLCLGDGGVSPPLAHLKAFWSISNNI